jgi:hypothetical protein
MWVQCSDVDHTQITNHFSAASGDVVSSGGHILRILDNILLDMQGKKSKYNE